MSYKAATQLAAPAAFNLAKSLSHCLLWVTNKLQITTISPKDQRLNIKSNPAPASKKTKARSESFPSK